MPLYEFRCPSGHDVEKFYRSIGSAPPEEKCPECGITAERRISAAGLVFKGSGFYRTDSRTQEKEPAGAGSTNGSAGTKADDAVKTVEKTGGGDGAKTGSGRKGESGAKKAASTPAA